MEPTHPPLEFVKAAFGTERLKKPQGLYMSARIGDTQTTEESIGYEIIEQSNGTPAGATYWFRGFRFLLWFYENDPRARKLGIEHLPGYEGLRHVYHPVQLKITDSFQRLNFTW